MMVRREERIATTLRWRVFFRVAREIEVRVRLFVDAAGRRRVDAHGASAIEEAVRDIVNQFDDPAGRT